MINRIVQKYTYILLIHLRVKNIKIIFFFHCIFILFAYDWYTDTKNDQVFFYHKSFLYFSFLSYVYSQRTITSYLITYSSSKCTLMSIIVIDSNDQFKLLYHLSFINRY